MHIIRDKRIKLQLTQETLAQRSGITRVNISRYETGERTPPLSTAKRIADALGCSVDDLLKSDDPS